VSIKGWIVSDVSLNGLGWAESKNFGLTSVEFKKLTHTHLWFVRTSASQATLHGLNDISTHTYDPRSLKWIQDLRQSSTEVWHLCLYLAIVQEKNTVFENQTLSCFRSN